MAQLVGNRKFMLPSHQGTAEVGILRGLHADFQAFPDLVVNANLSYYTLRSWQNYFRTCIISGLLHQCLSYLWN